MAAAAATASTVTHGTRRPRRRSNHAAAMPVAAMAAAPVCATLYGVPMTGSRPSMRTPSAACSGSPQARRNACSKSCGSSIAGPLLRFDIGQPCQARHVVQLLLDEGREALWRAVLGFVAKRQPTLIEDVHDVFLPQHFVDLGVELAHDRLGRASRRYHDVPQRRAEIFQ